MDMATIVWLVLLIGFIILEAACPIHLISIWFAVGALAAAVTAMLGGQFWLQAVVFAVVSGALLAALWPFVKKFLKPRLTKTNVDSVIDTEGYVTEDIDNLNAVGQVKLGGMYWTARSTAGQLIPKGTLVKVDRIEGVKAFVSTVKEEVNV
jgi:membrane protein implicated in regulation of membrane protease activity